MNSSTTKEKEKCPRRVYASLECSLYLMYLWENIFEQFLHKIHNFTKQFLTVIVIILWSNKTNKNYESTYESNAKIVFFKDQGPSFTSTTFSLSIYLKIDFDTYYYLVTYEYLWILRKRLNSLPHYTKRHTLTQKGLLCLYHLKNLVKLW